MSQNYSTFTADSMQWEVLIHGFAQAAHGRYQPPEAVLVCDSPKALQAALRFVKNKNTLFCLRSGRHNYEGQSSNSSGGYIIDTANIKTKKRIGLNTFRLGAGLTQIELVCYLQKFGFAIPYATGGTVGIAGLVLGGGVGLSSRTWGTVAHHVTRLHCVMADGSLRWISAQSSEGKAILGAGGGSLVALAEIEVRAHWKPLIPIFYARWDPADTSKVLLAFDANGPESDKRLGFVVRLGTDGTVALYGQCNSGGYFTARALLAKLLATAPHPIERKLIWLPHSVASRQFFRITRDKPLGWHAKIGSQLFKSSSALTSYPLTPEIADEMCNLISHHPKLKIMPEEVSMVQLLVSGGAMWDLENAHSPHYRSRVMYQLDGYWADESDKKTVLEWVSALRSVVEPVSEGSYVNYVDDSIPESQRSKRYYGEAYGSILAVKKELDPENFFNHTHSPQP